jgi:hypothetical protein
LKVVQQSLDRKEAGIESLMGTQYP